MGKYLGVAVIVCASALLLAACGTMRPPGSRDYVITHTVRPGDTLFSIAAHYGYDYREVAAWNKIRPPYAIFVGQRLVIISPQRYDGRGPPPVHGPNAGAGRSTTDRPPARVSVPAPTNPRVAPGRVHSSITHRPDPPRVATAKPQAAVTAADIDWHWPTEGRVIDGFSPADGKQGIDIKGNAGQAVFAAADGDVVYSGNGLLGYGNLIIIKHNETYLSAYGHNRKLLVKEGTKVKQGQKIAEMGQTAKTGSILHFQIRREGKPVDPMKYLPKR